MTGSVITESQNFFTWSFSFEHYYHFDIKSSDRSLGCPSCFGLHPVSSSLAPKGEHFDKKMFDGSLCLETAAQIQCRQWKHFTHKGNHKLCGPPISSLENSISDPMVVSTEKQMRVLQNCEGFHEKDTESCQFATFTWRTCLSPVETLRGRKSKSPRWFIYPSGFAHFLADLLIQPVDTCWTVFMCWELGCEGAIYKMLKKTQSLFKSNGHEVLAA